MEITIWIDNKKVFEKEFNSKDVIKIISATGGVFIVVIGGYIFVNKYLLMCDPIGYHIWREIWRDLLAPVPERDFDDIIKTYFPMDWEAWKYVGKISKDLFIEKLREEISNDAIPVLRIIKDCIRI